MAGNLQPWENVYVFISSTFNDMHAERDYLVKRVFPELSEWCEERRLRLVDIDLRWGVTEKDSQENKRVVDVCLTNIDRCRPLFLCFLGQRRGWVPDADDIAATTFENFPKLANHLGSSVTEMEIIHALIDPMMNGQVMELSNRERAFFFLRDGAYLEDIADQNVRNVYTNETEPDPAWTDAKLLAFRERIRQTGRPTLDYTARWDPDAATPELLVPGKPEGIDRGRLTDFECGGRELSEIVIGQLKEAISEQFPERGPAEAGSSLQRELDEQARFQQLASEGFIERTGDFDEIRAYLTRDDSRPCVVCAHAGLGKTSFLAQLIGKLRDEGTCEVLYRFVGTSESSVSAASLLASIGEELTERFGLEKVPSEVQKLREALPDLLAKAAEKAGRRLVVIIDAVNQLDTGLDDLDWIPAFLAGDVKFVYSFKLGDRAGDDLHDELILRNETVVLQLRGFENRDDRESLVEQFLSLYLKELDDDKIEAIVSSAGAANPLFLKVLLSELRVFGSHEGLRDVIAHQFGMTPQQAFDGLLRRLEGDPLYSRVPAKVLVANVFGWLSHSRNGLEPIELAEMLQENGFAASREEAVDAVNLILRQLRPYLAKRDKRQDFYYESFLLASRERYASPENGGKPDADWHRELAAYFEKRAVDNPRRLQELAFQYAHAGLSDKLVSLLTSYAFMEARLRTTGVLGIIDDYAYAGLPQAGINAEERDVLAFVREALEMSYGVLSKDTTQLAVQLHARLLGFDVPLIKEILDDAVSFLKERKIPWLKPLRACLSQPDGSIMRTFNTVGDAGLWLFEDRERMLICPQDDQAVKVVEVRTGRVLRTYPLGVTPKWISLIEKYNVFAVATMGSVLFVNMTTGNSYKAQDIEIPPGKTLVSYQDLNAAFAESGMFLSRVFNHATSIAAVYVTDITTGRLLHTFESRETDLSWGGLNGFHAAYDHETGYLLLSNEEEGATAYDPKDDFRIVRRYRNPNRNRFGEMLVKGPLPKYTRIYATKGSPFIIVVTKYDGLTVYEKHTGDVLLNVYGDGSSFRVTISAERNLLAFAPPVTSRSSERFVVYALDTLDLVASVEVGDDEAGIASLSFSERGDELFVGHRHERTSVWDTSSWQKIGTFSADDPRVNPVMTNARGTHMITQRKTEIVIRRADASKHEWMQAVDRWPKIETLAIAPDDSFAIARTRSHELYRIELPSLERTSLPKGLPNVIGITFSCDGRYFAQSNSDQIVVQDCATGELVGTVEIVDVTGTGHKRAREFGDPIFLPAELSLGPRNLTLLYEQWGCLVIQDPDEPDDTRIMQVFPGSVNSKRLYDEGRKVVVISDGIRFDPEAGGYDLNRTNDTSLPTEYKAYDLRTGECIEVFDDWKEAYLRGRDLDAHPVIEALLRVKEFPSELCRSRGRLVYHADRIKRSLTRPLVVRDDVHADPLCWFTTEEFKYGSRAQCARDGKCLFLEMDGFYPFSLENVLDVEPQPEPPSVAMPVRSEDALNELGFVLSHKEDINSQYEAYLVYTELVERFPKNGSHGKNRDIVERTLKRAVIRMGEEGDVEALQGYYERFRDLAQEHPVDDSVRGLLVWTESKLAFVLAHHDDLASKERAYELYVDLVKRMPKTASNWEALNKNRIVMAGLVADAYRALGKEQGDLESAKRAYEMFGQLAEELPDMPTYRNNQLLAAHSLAYLHLKAGLEGDIEHLRESRELYRDILVRDPENAGVKKNVDALEKKLAFLLSKQSDAESLRESLELYEMLAKRYPDEPLWEKNRGIVARQLEK